MNEHRWWITSRGVIKLLRALEAREARRRRWLGWLWGIV